jgi:hypothetical protein
MTRRGPAYIQITDNKNRPAPPKKPPRKRRPGTPDRLKRLHTAPRRVYIANKLVITGKRISRGTPDKTQIVKRSNTQNTLRRQHTDGEEDQTHKARQYTGSRYFALDYHLMIK